MRDSVEEAIDPKISVTNFPFASWKNMFESNNAIGDEIRYVFDRQKKENMMGNTLDKPTLLMQKTKVRTTNTNDEHAAKGDTYKKHDLSREVGAKMQQRVAPASKRMMRRTTANQQSEGSNIMKDLGNFLSQAPF